MCMRGGCEDEACQWERKQDHTGSVTGNNIRRVSAWKLMSLTRGRDVD